LHPGKIFLTKDVAFRHAVIPDITRRSREKLDLGKSFHGESGTSILLESGNILKQEQQYARHQTAGNKAQPNLLFRRIQTCFPGNRGTFEGLEDYL